MYGSIKRHGIVCPAGRGPQHVTKTIWVAYLYQALSQDSGARASSPPTSIWTTGDTNIVRVVTGVEIPSHRVARSHCSRV